MARKIQHKRGPEKDLPRLEIAEWALTTDTEKPFIGAASGNVEIAKKKDLEAVSSEVSKKADATEVTALGSQLADTETKTEVLATKNQIDFVHDLQKLSGYKRMNLQVTIGAYKFFRVNTEMTDAKGLVYEFGKNYNDDFILLRKGSIGNINRLTAVIDSKNYDSREGVFNATNPPNTYTTTIGDALLATFKGTKITFNSYVNNQGGLWEAILDEGTIVEQRKEISVFSASPVTIKEQVLFEGIPNQTHTIKLVFKGQDPANPITSPRGWYFTGGTRAQDTARTFNIYGDAFNITETTDALYGSSVKEFAVEGRPLGSAEAVQYMPEHNATGTVFNIVDSRVLVDGKQITWNTDNYYTDIDTVQIIQRLRGIHTSEPDNPLVEITHYHTIKNGVVTVSGKIKFLRDMEVTKASALNLPYYAAFAKKIKTSLGNSYDIITDRPNYQEYWVESDKMLSLAIVNDVDAGEKRDVALAMTIDNLDRTFRIGEEGRGDPFSWIEHRSDLMGKIYFRTVIDQTIRAGYELNFDGRYLVTYLPEVNQLVL